METVFDTLLAVDLNHLYFESTQAANLTVLPTAECQKKLNAYGLLFRTTKSGFTILYEAVKGDDNQLHPRRPIDANEKWTFMLRAHDPYLVNISDLPLRFSFDQVLYFNNLNANIQSGLLLISAAETHGYVSEADVIRRRPLCFAYRYKTDADQVEFAVSDEWQRTVYTKRKQTLNGAAACWIDLGIDGPGKYTLSIDGVEIEHFYAENTLMTKGKIIAVIDLYRHPSVPATYHFTDYENNDATPKTYTIMINRRQAFWRYFFVHKHRLTEMEPSRWPLNWPDDWPASLPDDWPDEWPRDWPKDWVIVFPEDQEITLTPEPSGMKLMPDGAMAIPFLSNRAIAFREVPYKGVRLSYQGANGNNRSSIREMDNLANPTFRNLVPDPSGSHVYSEIYIYL